jgi:hypothetical protein
MNEQTTPAAEADEIAGCCEVELPPKPKRLEGGSMRFILLRESGWRHLKEMGLVPPLVRRADDEADPTF